MHEMLFMSLYTGVTICENGLVFGPPYNVLKMKILIRIK